MTGVLEMPGVRRVPYKMAYPRFRELIDRGSSEHLAIYTGMSFDDDAVQQALPSARERRARGVRLRTIAPVGSAEPDIPPEDLAALDGDHRRLARPPLSLDIIDRRVALLPLDPACPEGDQLEVWAPSLVAGLLALFERQWADARPLGSGLAPRERAVIGLLAEGCTDAVVARTLGISERTVTSTVRGLLDRYGARSRFQLAAILSVPRDTVSSR